MKSLGNIHDKSDSMSRHLKEQKFSEHILNNSRSMLSIINRDYVYEKVNTTFCKALQGVADSIVGKPLYEVWGQEIFLKNIKDNLDSCFSGNIVKYEASFIVPQSGRRFFEVIFRPIPEESGRISHILAETFDITDIRLSEKIALGKEEEFRRFETNLPIGFLRCKTDGGIVHSNQTFNLIFEIGDVENVSGKNLREFYGEEWMFDHHLDQLADNKPKSFGRIPLKTCKNNAIVCRVSAFMGLDYNSGSSYIDFSFEDSSRELMLENRLMQAQKLETIGALAGGIAHDFNNILATISGYSELLHEDLPRSSPSYQQVSRIQTAVAKARSLTNQMLAFSRQMEQEKVIINVNEVLKETISFVKTAAPENVTIKDNIRKQNTPVYADPTQLFRIFLNLMTNAIQALDQRKGIISVSIARVNGKDLRDGLNKMIVADEYVMITFRDTGKGMDPTLIRRIFEPFFTTREVGKGSGLGLSVVHGIVTEMGGEILVSSEKDKGSVFYVYLPVDANENERSFPSEARKRILFISGNRHESRILSIALESAGYNLVIVSDNKSLAEALSARNESPELIIYMADTENIKPEALQMALSNSSREIPCIMIDDPEVRKYEEKSLNLKIVSQHLSKPVSLKEIKNAIQMSIKK